MDIDALILLIALTALNERRIDVNIYDIVSLQDVTDGKLVGEGAKCHVTLVTAKSLSVRETCERVRDLIDEAITQ